MSETYLVEGIYRRRVNARNANPGGLGCIGNEQLATYIGIIRNYFKDPYKRNQYNGM